MSKQLEPLQERSVAIRVTSTNEYPFYPTGEQVLQLNRWFGHHRALHNSIVEKNEQVDTRNSVGSTARWIAENSYCLELPDSVLGETLIELVSGHASAGRGFLRKRDRQSLILHTGDFVLTETAKVLVAGLGDIDVEFDEGPPTPDPDSIELSVENDQYTIKLKYSGAFSE